MKKLLYTNIHLYSEIIALLALSGAIWALILFAVVFIVKFFWMLL